MKFTNPHSVSQIANLLNCKFVGDPNFEIFGMNEIHLVEKGDIVFVDHPKYYDKALKSNATTILINKDVVCPEGKSLLISDDPFRDFNKLIDHFNPFQSANTAISNSAKIGVNTLIQPNCFIGNNVVIGNNCTIHANVSIYDDTIIGDNVIINSGTVLGSNAFYYKNRPDGFDRLKSGGRVVLQNRVEIGANCTIDKGVTGDTTIGEGSVLDNLIQIGHDTKIGKRCLIAAQVGIAGCVVIEDFVTIWGQVGITSGVVIGTKSVILAQSGVTKSLEGNKSYFGSPAEDARLKYKEMTSIKQIPQVLETLLSKK